MPERQSDLLSAIVIISLIFLIICLGLIVFVTQYYRRKKNHAQEKETMQHQFYAEILKTQIEVQEQTMQTIATDLHDNIGQLLSLTNLTLGSIDLKNLKKSTQKIETSINLVNTSIKELRDLAKLFQGEQLIEISLYHAIAQEINWLEKSDRYLINASIELADITVQSSNKDLIILRLLQEIFNNIIKHSSATEVLINAYLKEDVFYLTVRDNGVGFDHTKAMEGKNGLGLHSLYKRIQLINGEINIESSSTGTNITIKTSYP